MKGPGVSDSLVRGNRDINLTIICETVYPRIELNLRFCSSKITDPERRKQ